MKHNPYPVPQSDRALTAVAWGVILLASALPEIAWAELGGGSPAWLAPARMGLLVALALGGHLWEPARPLRRFAIALLGFYVLSTWWLKFDFAVPLLQRLLGGSAFDVRMQAEQTGKLAVSLAMIALLFVLGYRRRDFFLVRGDLRAPIEPVPWLGFPRPEPWPSFGLQWSLYIAAALRVTQYLGLRPSAELLRRVVPILPSILFYAALNAFNEEVTYRSPLLATLEPVGGSRQALWIAATFFGVAHYFGTPSGLAGAVLSIFMGWILGKGMVETRGFFWTWWIHFLSDAAIFTFLALALLT